MLEESRQVLAWMDFLDHIEQSLDESLALAPEPAGVAAAGLGSGAAALHVLDERLTRFQTCLEQAARNAEEAEALVKAEEEALSALARRIGPAREKLASGAKRPAEVQRS